MLMQQLGKELLLSIPIPVHFSGFKATTLELARGGWDLSMRQELSFTSPHTEIQLAMRHGNKDVAIYALSAPLHVDPMQARYMAQNYKEFVDFMKQMFFEIMYVSNQMSFRTIIPRMGVSSFAESFMPIDATPQERTTKEENIEDFKFFKIAKPDVKDLIVSPDQVPELLDLVLKTQKKTQEELRARAHSRENLRKYRNGEMFEAKPAHTVQAQLITLAG